MSRGMQWEVDKIGTRTRVSILGSVDEEADFEPLKARLAKELQLSFDLAGLTRINSCGVREWVNFIRGLASASIELEKCSPPFVAQINMISNFVGSARVRSIVAEFVCHTCRHEQQFIFDLSNGVPDLSTRRCEKCGQESLEFDDLPEHYLAFLGT
ncbi:MAG: hypothetical protein H7Z43_07980 [Clostridia bacterium]|nr:hypothetical protein [Deltaproteobacteria bacterium]